jgi:integrase
MPSLWKRENSPYWTCCFTAKDGRQLKKSTKQKNRTEAMAMCLALEKAEKDGIHGRLTEAQARKIVAEIVERTTGTSMAFHTVRTWMDSWVAGKGESKSRSTATRYAQIIADFVEHLGLRAELGLPHITPADIQSYRQAERAKGKSPQTCNQAVKIVGSAFNAARRQNHISNNPTEALDPLPEEAAEKKPFTTEQVESLLQVASPDWQGAILFGYYTGARLQDIANMKWSAVDLEKNLLEFIPRKTERTKKSILVPIHPRLLSYLLSHSVDVKREGFLFRSLAGKSTAGKSGLSMAFARLMATAKVDPGRVERDNGLRASSELSFHSLRHTFNSGLANSGVIPEVRQKLTGHATTEMNAVYTHHDVEPLRDAVHLLPTLKIAPPVGGRENSRNG